MRARDEAHNGPKDRAFHPAGTGHHSSFMCMGCNAPQLNLGARGAGVRKRCAGCVEREAERRKERAGL